MSLILDALNKAERERDISEGIPDLTTLHHAPRSTPSRDLWLVGLAGAVVALLMLVGFLLFFWRHDRVPDSPVSVAASSLGASEASQATSLPQANPRSNLSLNSSPAAEVQALPGAPTDAEATIPVSASSRDPILAKSSLLPSEVGVNPEVKALYQVQYGEVVLTEPEIAVSHTDSAHNSKAAESGPAPWQSLIDDVSLDTSVNDDTSVNQANANQKKANHAQTAQQINDSYNAVSERAIRGSLGKSAGDDRPSASASSADDSTADDTQGSMDENLARVLWEQTRIQPVPESVIASARVVQKPVSKPAPEPEVDLSSGKNLEDTLAGYSNIPFLHELPEATQNRIPSILYALHTYDKKTVTLNQKKVVEGGAVANDLIVERILADGVLLKFKGQSFKLAALSSWVNN